MDCTLSEKKKFRSASESRVISIYILSEKLYNLDSSKSISRSVNIMETIKEVKFFVTVGGRLSRYMEIVEEILINIDEEDIIIDLTNENSLDKDANEDDEEADGNSTIDMTVDEEAQTPPTPEIGSIWGEDVDSSWQ